MWFALRWRLFIYVGVLALFGIRGIDASDNALRPVADQPRRRCPTPRSTWSVADRSDPAFALSTPDASDKSEKPDTYTIHHRNPLGGRRDILRWSGTGEKPTAELEIYRSGREYGPASAAQAELMAGPSAPRLRPSA